MKKISLPKSDAQVSPKSKKARLPLAVKIIYGVAAACAPLYLIFLFSEGFSDFFNRYISSFFRAILAHSTSFIPFSVAEFALLLLPVWVFLITRAITRRYGESLKELLYSFVCVFSMVALIFSSFTLAFAPAYRGSTLDKKLCIERQNVSARELYDTAMILSSHLAEESKNVNYALDGFSVMPYDYSEMNKNLLDAYGNVCDEYSFIPRLKSRLKPVMLSGRCHTRT